MSGTQNTSEAKSTSGSITIKDFMAKEEFQHSSALKISKRIFDILMSMLFFIAFGWLYFLLWIGVVVTSGRPAMYSQPRYGKDGKIFKFYKFRSMVANSDAVVEEHLRNNPAARKQWDDYQKLENDPRITKFGSFIRKTSLDELPQFWNVLKGDMSIVGPRPCMISQKILYGQHWATYCQVRPGITGLWQVSGRNKLNYQTRVTLDDQYVRNLSLKEDAIILARTVFVVATGHGSR